MSFQLKKKGGKQFMPKFPVKRPGAPSSAQSSARPSVERQSQTPAPRPIETITIPDDDGTPDLTEDPARTLQITPHQPVVERPQDTLPYPHSSAEDRPTRNASAHIQNATLIPNKESLKRKTRDDAEGEGEGPLKRHQPATLDAPRSPPQSTFFEASRPTEIQMQLAEPAEPARLSTSESTQTESQPIEPSQSAKVKVPSSEIPGDEIPSTETLTNVESKPTTQAPTIRVLAASSQRHPLPDNMQDDSEDDSDSEVATTGLGSAGGASGLGAAGDVGSGVEGGQVARTPVIVPMAPLNPDGTPGELVQQPATGTKKKVPKRRKVQEAEDGDDVRATVEMQLNRPRRAPGKKQTRKKKDDAKKKSKRAETPDGAENEEINEKEIKMSELCKDLRIGQKFSRHDELREREKQKMIKAQLAKTNPELASMVEGAEPGEEGSEAAGPPGEGESGEEVEQPVITGGGMQMRIVDGQIVMDETSTQLNRQANAQAQQGEIEEVHEHEFSKITTSGTYMKRERAQLWDMAANEIFWKGLRMFGTDFEMIAKMFPNRNRRQIKLKFNKEEKDNPSKIDRILKGQGNSIELDTYEELSGVKLEEVADIEAERERVEAEQKAEEDRRIAELAEIEKKKKAVIAQKKDTIQRVLVTTDDDDEGGDLGDYGDNGDSGEKENQPGPNSSTPLAPGEKPKYFWTRPSEAERAQAYREEREISANAAQTKQYPWSKAPKAPKVPKPKKDGTARKTKKKKGAPDETVEVLGDA